MKVQRQTRKRENRLHDNVCVVFCFTQIKAKMISYLCYLKILSDLAIIIPFQL